MCSLDLKDMWRKLHPNKKQLNRQKSNQIKCRLDYWLTSKQSQQQSSLRKWEIILLHTLIIRQCAWKLRKKYDNQEDQAFGNLIPLL